MISIVSPVYKAAWAIPELVREVRKAVISLEKGYEIILVEDRSPDESWSAIEAECKKDPNVKGIRLSRNFGQHYAITAGLEASKGEWVVVMDCDLQDRPDQIGSLYHKTEEGYDIVFARRTNRKDGFLKRLSSRLFYRVFGYLTDTHQDAAIANFGIYSRKVIDAVLEMKDHVRYFPTMSQWVGFNKSYIDIEHGIRSEDKSSYSWPKLFQLAWNNIIAFSDKPLRLTIQFGVLISTVSGILGLYYLAMYFTGNIEVSGFTSLIISIWFLSGTIIFLLGIIGVYLGKTFDRVKNRPIYIIDQKVNF